MNSTVALLVVMTITFVFTSFAHSAPGEPRLVQGVLEWPARLTAEPFVVVHTEDGRWYYAEIKTAKHLESAPLTSGMRVSILGTEAKNPHEINAIALGSGDAAALAMALMPLVGPTAAAMAPAPPVRAPQPTAPDAPPPATPPSVRGNHAFPGLARFTAHGGAERHRQDRRRKLGRRAGSGRTDRAGRSLGPQQWGLIAQSRVVDRRIRDAGGSEVPGHGPHPAGQSTM